MSEPIDRRRMATLKIYIDAKGEFRWRLVAFNGRILCVSGEGFKTRVLAVQNWRRTAGRILSGLVDETGASAMPRR
jgi:uncharacterized protein YegP (UPF0339 family)